MKKYLFIAGMLIAFIAATFNSPAKVISADEQEITCVDDTTTKVKSKSSATSKESAKKGCPSKSAKTCCEKGGSKTSKGEKSTKDCSKTVKKK